MRSKPNPPKFPLLLNTVAPRNVGFPPTRRTPLRFCNVH